MGTDQPLLPSSIGPLAVWVQGTERNLLPGPTYSLGRDPASDIVVDDARVSWRHAVLKLERDAWISRGRRQHQRNLYRVTACRAGRDRCRMHCPARPPGRRARSALRLRRAGLARPGGGPDAPGLHARRPARRRYPSRRCQGCRAMPQSPAWPAEAGYSGTDAGETRRSPAMGAAAAHGAMARFPAQVDRVAEEWPRAYDRRRPWTGCAGQTQASAAHLRAAATGHRAADWPGTRQRRGRRRP